MAVKTFSCPSCGAPLDAASKPKFCEYCGAAITIENNDPSISPENAEEAGYHFEKGRLRAMREQAAKRNRYAYTQTRQPETGEPKKKRRTWLWVLGWIFCFPIPLTVLIARSEKLNTAVKVLLLIFIWGAILGSQKSTRTVRETPVVQETTRSIVIETSSAQSETTASAAEATVYLDPIVTDYGYKVINGYLMIAYELYNPNEDRYVAFPKVRVTARDSAGKLLGTYDTVHTGILPQETTFFGDSIFKLEEEPATVEVLVIPVSEYMFQTLDEVDRLYEPLTVSDCRLEGYKIMGEIYNPNHDNIKSVSVVVFYRDKDDRILYGDTAYVSDVLADTTTAFSTYISEPGEYDHFTVEVCPW